MGGGVVYCEDVTLGNGTVVTTCEEGVAPYIGLYFLFIGMTLGALTLWFQVKFLPWLPFTALMFLEGIALGILQSVTDAGMGDLSLSLTQWQNIDPLLLMAVFLPALIFSDAFRINVHQFQTTAFWPSMVLAGPGVIANTFAMAYVAQAYLGYEWSFKACLLFGAVLGSTDPVSVTAMVESSGVPQRLKLLMSSESHLADLTVLVMFKIGLDLVTLGGGLIASTAVAAEFIARMLFVGPITGLCVGLIGYAVIVQSVSPTRSSDVLIQVTTTVVVAYMSFLVAEHNLSGNGILSSVCAAWVIAAKAWPKFAKRETMENVWDSIAYFGNTLIYLLAGAIIGETFLNKDISDAALGTLASSEATTVLNLDRDDWINVVTVWLWLFAIRALIVYATYPMLYMTSKKQFTIADAALLVFGGLRGGVTITLAIIVKNTARNPAYKDFLIEQFGQDYLKDLDRFFFIIGSVTLLTLVFNYTLFPGLARLLKVSKVNKSTERLHDQLRQRVRQQALHVLDTVREKDPGHYGHVTVEDMHDLVSSSSPDNDAAAASDTAVVATESRSPGGGGGGGGDAIADPETVELGDCNMLLLKEVRGMFLNAVRAQYWEQINEGKLPRKSNAALKLLNSVDQALDAVAYKLDDLSPLALDSHLRTDDCLPRSLSLCGEDGHLSTLLRNSRHEAAVVKATCLIEAHEHAEQKIAMFVGEDESIDTPEEAYVIKESMQLRKEASAFLDRVAESDREVLRHVQRVKLANSIIEQQRLYVESLHEQGLADERFYEAQMVAVRKDQMALERKSRARMRKLASKRVSMQRERRRSLRKSLERDTKTTAAVSDGGSNV